MRVLKGPQRGALSVLSSFLARRLYASTGLNEIKGTKHGKTKFFTVLLSVLAATGCGSTPSSNSGGPIPISIALSTMPPASMQTNQTATIAAKVSNDSANQGVAWSCAPSGSCGSFSPVQTATGAMTTYTAPAAMPQGGSVTIHAASVSDTTKTAAANVTITTQLVVSVVMTTAPPASMRTGTSASVAATVSNDSANKGVTWSCAPSAACGSFTPAQTASGVSTTYTAPTNVPAGGNVTITATSVSDTTKNATANVAITAPPISVAITTAPPASMEIDTTASVAATVSNDSANKGVTWSCAPSAACGSFTPTQTASGAATTYTAPAAVPAGGNVTITATSVSDFTKTASVTAAITSLSGQYCFLVTGQDINGSYAAAGSLTFDGNGNITAGEQDFSNITGATLDPVVTGTYAVRPDGRGTMTLNLPVLARPETFAFTITSSSHALLSEDDGAATGSGVLDLQTPGAAFAASQFFGGYSFTLTGEDVTFATATVFGGVFTADGTSTLSLGTLDENDSGALTTGASFSGTFTGPDTNGRGTITFTTGPAFAYTYYLVRPQVLRLTETDTLFVSGGTAYGQGAASSFGNSSLAGPFVFNNVGSSVSGSSFAAAGQFAADGNGNFTGGIADANDNGLVSSGSLVASTYAFINSPRGTITIPAGAVFASGTSLFAYLVDPNLNLLDPNNASGGGGALLLTNDANIFGVGMIVPQVTPAPSSLAGNYAVNLTSAPNNAGTEADLTGQVVADLSGNLNGTADYANDAGSSTTFGTANATYTGTFTPDINNPGRLTGTVLLTGGTLQFVPGGATQNLSYYQADGSRMFAVETDANVTAGLLMHQ